MTAQTEEQEAAEKYADRYGTVNTLIRRKRIMHFLVGAKFGRSAALKECLEMLKVSHDMFTRISGIAGTSTHGPFDFPNIKAIAKEALAALSQPLKEGEGQ